jgi:hypothetical protein
MADDAVKEVELKLETGEVFKGKDYEEVAKKVAAAQEESHRTLQAERARAATAEELAEVLRQKTAPAEKTNGHGFDLTHWNKLMTEGDVVGAFNYADSIRFGVAPEEVVPTITNTVRVTAEMRDAYEIQKFKNAHEDYPATKEAGEALTKWLKDEWGKEWDSGVLSFGYKQLAERGVIKPLEEKQHETGQEPPPMLGGTSAATGGGGISIEDFQKMNPEQRREYLRKEEAAGR